MLALVDGRYPAAAGELAVTDDVAASLGVGIGDRIDLGGTARTVVGRVENPADLGDEFALVPPSELDRATSLSLLVDAGDDRIDAFRQAIGGAFGRHDRAGWLVETPGPLIDAGLERAREAAGAAGLFLESREAPVSTATLRTVATAIGLLVALGILAMTVGLLRSEAAGDLRTLTATGASSRVRRAITAATAAALAFLGAVLGTVGAYLALVASYLHDLVPLGRIPLLHLLAILVGLPVAAALAGWLLAGREPSTFARQPT